MNSRETAKENIDFKNIDYNFSFQGENTQLLITEKKKDHF